MRCSEFDTLTLFSYIAEDLDDVTRKKVTEHLKSCGECELKIKQMQQEKTEFLNAYPDPQIHTELKKLSKTKTSVKYSVSLYALAATLVLMVSAGLVFYNQNYTAGYRIKGATQVTLYVQDENGNPVKRDNNTFFPGEKIQFTYSCGNNRYFMLLSADSNHSISVYYPSEGTQSIQLEPGQDLPLPNSIILDSYIGPELYLAVFSASPLDVTHITRQLTGLFQQNESLSDLHPGFENAVVQSILIEKKELLK
jgi:hypothetical protein